MYPSEKSLGQAAGEGVHGLRDRQPGDDRRGRADRAAAPTQQATEAKKALDAGRGGSRLSWKHGSTQPTRATPALGVARRRVGEDVIKGVLLLAALLSVLTTTGIVISLLRETITFFESVGFSEFLFGTDWSPVIKPQSFGVLPLVTGTFLVTGIALLVAVPLGPRLGDLPQRVRHARACARRSSRRSRCSPACRRSCSATSRSRSSRPNVLQDFAQPRRRRLQRAVRRDHHGLHGHPDHRVGVRGRDVGGARSRCARAPSASAPPGSRSRCGWSSRPRSRASSRRSCSASRARSARR